MKISDEQLLNVLLKTKRISRSIRKEAISRSKLEAISPIDYLLSNNALTPDNIGEAYAKHAEVTYTNLHETAIPSDVFELVPPRVMATRRIVAVAAEKKTVIIATDDPENRKLKKELSPLFPKRKIIFTYSLPEDIDLIIESGRPIKSAENRQTPTTNSEVISTIASKTTSPIAAPTAKKKYSSPLKKIPVLPKELKLGRSAKSSKSYEISAGSDVLVPAEFLQQIFSNAAAQKVQTVVFDEDHGESQSGTIQISFITSTAKNIYSTINDSTYRRLLRYVKIEANLRTDITNQIQRGIIRLTNGDRDVTIQVTITPSISDEVLSLQLLSTSQNITLPEKLATVLSDLFAQQDGVVLVTGTRQARSGDTIRSILRIAQTEQKSVALIESLSTSKESYVQIETHNRGDLTTSKALQGLLTQKRDIIGIDSSEDSEDISLIEEICAAGQSEALILANIHHPEPTSLIPQLLKQGIEPTSLSASLKAILGIKKVKSLCSHCKQGHELTKSELKRRFPRITFSVDSFTLYEPQGCTLCNNTGYAGETVLFEFLLIDDELRSLIHESPSTAQFKEKVNVLNAINFFNSGLEKAISGEISLSDLVKVASVPTSSKGGAK